MKSGGAGMFAPEHIRELVKQAQASEEDQMPSQSPARKPARPQRPLSANAQAVVKRIFEDVAKQQDTAGRAAIAAYDAAMRKAKKDDPAPVAVYDENGNLVGVIHDPEAITPIQGAKSPAADKPQPAPADAPVPQAGPAAAAAPQPTAKGMSLGARGHQLGGPNPRGGVPTVPASAADDEALDTAITKAVAYGATLKKQIGPNSGTPAAEQARITAELDQLATAVLSATLARPRRA